MISHSKLSPVDRPCPTPSCMGVIEQANAGPWMAIELSWLLPFLARNLHVDVKQTMATIRAYNR